MIMGVELGFICAADFDNAIRYKVRRPASVTTKIDEGGVPKSAL